MNARARRSPETREPDIGNLRLAGGVDVAMGTCLCGTVHYAVDHPLETLSHYNDPASGEQRGATDPVLFFAPLVAFRWVAGQEWLTNYDSEKGSRRSFCRWCGSSMPVSTRDNAAMLLPLASLNMSVPSPRAPDQCPPDGHWDG